MGILNVTPDSFSDGGRFRSADAAIRRALEMVQEGADCIDIGGESTRPGSAAVDAAEQIDRVAPVIRGVRRAGAMIPISIDTQSAEVAAAALDAGADIVNDISAARIATGVDNADMRALLAARDVPYIIMHMQGTPATMQAAPHYDDVVREVGDFFEARARALEAAGVATEGRMIVDPGIGFGKTIEHNLALMREAAGFGARWPVLLGTSRKQTLGRIIAAIPGRSELPGPGARLMGTAASVAHAALTGVDMVRVHDVREMREVVEVCCRIAGRRGTGS